MPAVVSDASVLICLGAIQQIQILEEFFQEVFIPDAVWREVMVASGLRAGGKETSDAVQKGWLKVRTPGNRALVTSLQITLDSGEAEAIALATELGSSLLLIDESDGRTEARSLGMQVTGTLGIPLKAKVAGLIPALKPLLDTLIAQNSFRLGKALYTQALQAVGETP